MSFPEEQVARLSQSFELIEPDLEEVVAEFYKRLFATSPQIRSLFPTDIDRQKQQMFSTLMLIAHNLAYINRLEEPLRKMGISHADYGIEESHFTLVRNALVSAMEYVAQDSWNHQLHTDWKLALDTVSGYMIQGLREAQSKAA